MIFLKFAEFFSSRRVTSPVKSMFFASVVLVTGCDDSTRENDTVVVTQEVLDATLQEAVDLRILVAVDQFKMQAAALKQGADDFCVLQTEGAEPPLNAVSAGVVGLQNDWRNVAQAWYRLLPYNFGPLNDDVVFPEYIKVDSYRLNGTDYTGTVRTDIAKNVAGSFVLNDAYFAQQAFQKLGLAALEISLFETLNTQTNAPEAIASDFMAHPRKCQVVQGLAQQLNVSAEYFERGWRNNYNATGHSYRQQFLAAELDDGMAPMTQLLASVQGYLDYLKKRGVVNNRAQLSGEAWVLMSVAIDEVEALLNGTGRSQFNLFAVMASNGYGSSVAAVKANIAALRTSINSQDAGVFETYLGLLDGNFKREIPNALDVQLGLNFSDGD